MVIAELRDTFKNYGATKALAGFSLELERGRLVALLGRNGAGKTTATRLLSGLARPDAGQARLFGRDPKERAARQRVGVLLQSGRVPETLTVEEQIRLFSSYYPKPLELGEVLRAAGLEELRKRQAGRLSGGERQRLLFALALCGRPELLILDEPTVGLDVESRRALWGHIRGYLAGGGGVLLTTHYLEEADALADRVVVIDRGREVANGSTAEIKRMLGGRQVECETALEVERLLGWSGVLGVVREGGRTVLTVEDSDAVLRRLMLEDPGVRGVQVRGAALEEAFLALTAGAGE